MQQRKKEREEAMEQQAIELADIERQRAMAEGMEANEKEEEVSSAVASVVPLGTLKPAPIAWISKTPRIT